MAHEILDISPFLIKFSPSFGNHCRANKVEVASKGKISGFGTSSLFLHIFLLFVSVCQFSWGYRVKCCSSERQQREERSFEFHLFLSHLWEGLGAEPFFCESEGILLTEGTG